MLPHRTRYNSVTALYTIKSLCKGIWHYSQCLGHELALYMLVDALRGTVHTPSCREDTQSSYWSCGACLKAVSETLATGSLGRSGDALSRTLARVAPAETGRSRQALPKSRRHCGGEGHEIRAKPRAQRALRAEDRPPRGSHLEPGDSRVYNHRI